jgi:hypothetical protein
MWMLRYVMLRYLDAYCTKFMYAYMIYLHIYIARLPMLYVVLIYYSKLSHAPRLRSIAADPAMEVRSKLAQTVMDCVGSYDAEDGLGSRPLSDSVTLQVYKLLLEGFLNDEFAEVQLHVLNMVSRVNTC